MHSVASTVGLAVVGYAEGGVKLCKYVDNKAIGLSSGLNMAPTVRRSIQRILALNIKEVCSALSRIKPISTMSSTCKLWGSKVRKLMPERDREMIRILSTVGELK